MKNKTENEIIRVALYIRVSTEEQAKHGYSLESQETRLKEYCKQKNYKVIDIYRDEGKSARSKINLRTELLRMIADAEYDKFDRIIMWRLDRWFRSVADYYRVQDVLEKHKVDWECTDEEYNTTTSNGRLHLNIKLSIAQNESDQTSDRIKFNFENMIKNKKAICCSHSCPLGYKVEGERGNKHMVIDSSKAELVNFIFDTYELTNNYRKTAVLVNEKFNYPIQPCIITKMLKKTIYYGEYKNVANYTEAYISKERWDKIQDMIPKNVKQNKNHEYIFSGLIVCKLCGGKMSAGTHRGLSRYRCKKYKETRNCNNAKQIAESKLENYLLSILNDLKDTQLKLVAKEKDNSKNVNVEKEVEKINKKINRLNDLYIEGNISREKYDDNLLSFKSKQKELLKLKVKVKRKNIISLPDNAIDLYKMLNNENRRAFWSKYIDYIEFDPNHSKFEDRISLILK